MHAEAEQSALASGVVKNAFYYLTGIGFLGLAAGKHWLEGYKTPKPFGLSDFDRCIDYDIKIADNWLKHLATYGRSIEGMDVLELGPGSDLGTGAYLLHRGAKSYRAFDRHPLASQAPAEFYKCMSARFPVDPIQLKFTASENFDLSVLPANSVDVVVSNAAFEHFDDVERTVKQLSHVVRPGGCIVAVIDLQTHSRWIREVDPANIYRYPTWLYRAFYFSGQPNRVRAYQYRQFFTGHGWQNVWVKTEAFFNSSGTRVHKQFRDPRNEMDQLSICLCATR